MVARRIIAQRCLYGVDKNPLAVEMAKLSLWLLTLAKDKPFEFLDHAIRCGDSLVGIHDLDQLKNFNLDPSKGRSLFTGPVFNLVDEAVALRQKIETMPSNSVEDVEAQEKLLSEAEEKTARLRCAADLLLSVEFQGANAAGKQSLHDSMAIQAGHYVENGTIEEFKQAVRKALKGQQTFHWPLEFPEVFQKRGGFDAFVGNPPFLGGTRIRSVLGANYLQYLQTAWGKGNSADLCTCFFLRSEMCLQRTGCFGLLATNSVAQGDSRSYGLDRLVNLGISIPRAVSSMKWPGEANLEVSEVWCRKGDWGGGYVLDGRVVSGITSALTETGIHLGEPHRLAANSDKSFLGSYVLGMGFVLTPEEAQRLLEKDARNKNVVFPYLNGEDLTSRPDQSPSRWVINFFDWQLEKAMEYPACFQIVEERVKPERTRKNDRNEFVLRKPLPQRWWIYADKRPALYATIAEMRRVLIASRVSAHHFFDFSEVGKVFSDRLVVIALESYSAFSVLSSTIHDAWAHRPGTTTHETRSTYFPEAAFETFPFPRESRSCPSNLAVRRADFPRSCGLRPAFSGSRSGRAGRGRPGKPLLGRQNLLKVWQECSDTTGIPGSLTNDWDGISRTPSPDHAGPSGGADQDLQPLPRPRRNQRRHPETPSTSR